jgi:MFS family permease
VPPRRVTKQYSWYALGLLAVINLLNYLDRNVIFALFEPIKQDLGLTDTQLGWLGSAYILVFSVAALPFGVLSDLRSRRAVISGGVAVWSLFTSLGGLVRTYTQLFLCRAAVGIGEAAYGPAASSLVADYFPGPGRAIAMGILSSGIALGGVLGILLGGWLESLYGWRVAFMAVGLPGFVCAVLVARLIDPTRVPTKLTLRAYLKELELGAASVVRQFWPLLISLALGTALAYVLDRRYGVDSRIDVAAMAAAVSLGVAVTILRWVRLIRLNRLEETPFGGGLSDTFAELTRAGWLVLRTPTLVYIFVAGAMISFGMNGLVGWGPTFLSRELGLTPARAAGLLGGYGLVAGTAGTLFGGFFADWLRRWTLNSRVITVSAGFLIGGPLAFWALTLRDPDVFKWVFLAAFFCLSWYNGPIGAAIFDVVPARIGATVMGAYLLFIHLAGDAIAFPLVGGLSDRFGLELAVLLLPVVAFIGGGVMLGATRTMARDMARVD